MSLLEEIKQRQQLREKKKQIAGEVFFLPWCILLDSLSLEAYFSEPPASTGSTGAVEATGTKP